MNTNCISCKGSGLFGDNKCICTRIDRTDLIELLDTRASYKKRGISLPEDDIARIAIFGYLISRDEDIDKNSEYTYYKESKIYEDSLKYMIEKGRIEEEITVEDLPEVVARETEEPKKRGPGRPRTRNITEMSDDTIKSNSSNQLDVLGIMEKLASIIGFSELMKLDKSTLSKGNINIINKIIESCKDISILIKDSESGNP